jgi:hypothetical protein
MNTSEFVKTIKNNFEVLPTRTEVKNFINQNKIDINKSTDEITLMLVNAYRGINYRSPKQRKEYNTKNIKKEDIQKCMDMGMLHPEIAQYLGISTCKLSQLKANYDLLKKTKKLDDKEFKEFMKYHTQQEAAKHFHKDQSEINRTMRSLKIKGKRDFLKLWLELKEKVDKETLKLMIKMED